MEASTSLNIPLIGQIIMFAGVSAPAHWAMCDGTLLDITQHHALFNVIGTTYGGDGRTNFALPDLRSRVAVGAGLGVGLEPIKLGAHGGAKTTVLAESNLAKHQHDVESRVYGLELSESLGNPKAGYFAIATSEVYYSGSGESIMHNGLVSGTSGNTGAGKESIQGFATYQPYQVINYIIALTGKNPQRS